MPNSVIYITAIMLFFGAAPLPYGYYTLLRIAACGFFVWAAFIAFERKNKILPWAFAVFAILFNPFIKIHLPKELWVIIDTLLAVFILATRRKIADLNSAKA
tara:strand:+ start:3243 stop:3548 length:306 start_codon:yes stop_codon:yes gene_type:complete